MSYRSGPVKQHVRGDGASLNVILKLTNFKNQCWFACEKFNPNDELPFGIAYVCFWICLLNWNRIELK